MAKFSYYNFSVENPEGGFILFNSLTKNIVLLTDEDYKWMKNVNLEETDKNDERFATLYDLNFIVDNDFDELV